MLETRKERRMRSLLLFICIGFTIGALYYKYNNQKEISNPPLVTVLHQSLDKEDNPIIVLAKKQENNYILAEYEVQLNNNYLFKTMKAATLEGKPTKLSLDKESEGIWVEIDDEWNYFTSDFELAIRSPKYRERTSAEQSNIIVREERGRTIVQVEDKQLDLGERKIKQLYPLATDGSLWLVVTDQEIIISTT
ncbi:hypothetical protein [Robertmurraya korlensis]|uniref:hypothetical protein n=1 Tax=Robertmurraya korlensis TaxID=519977 RepID=UPI0012EDE390|nr:hypothetical protein [Robertmurraya korlensis]